MTKAERTVNLIAVVLPFVAFLAAIILLWNSLATRLEGWSRRCSDHSSRGKQGGIVTTPVFPVVSDVHICE